MPELRKIEVVSSEFLTPNMKRVVFSGEDLSDFPPGYEGGYVKLLFNLKAEAISCQSQLQNVERKDLLIRTYSVRAFDKANLKLTIDFALHHQVGICSPASDWARSAKPGDGMVISGPGSVKMAEPHYDWFFFVGDMSGLPAISCNLEALPKYAKGYAVIEIASEEDKQQLDVPDNFEIIWLVNPHPSVDSELLTKVSELNWLDGKVFVWSACEFDNMKRLRRWFKREKAIEKEDIYISSYWKFGHTEDQHKIVKKADASTQG